MELALDHHRIDQRAGVLQRVIAQDAHRPGLDIDLDLRDLTAIGVGEVVDAELAVGLEPRLDAGRKGIARRAAQDARQLAELDRKLRRADHAHLAVRQFEIVFGRFEHVARELLGLVRDGARRQQHGRSGGDGLAAGEGAEPERYAGCVARHHVDVLRAQA